MEQHKLECPFDHGECKFTTTSDDEYIQHTKIHKPTVMKVEDRLWDMRLKIAKKYADPCDPKRPWHFAQHCWDTKPKDMLCSTITGMLQDFGVKDNDNLAGLMC